MNKLSIDNNWTLFLDRDGVINHEIHMGYANTWDDFKFYDGVKNSFKIFAAKFKHIIVVTNQRGVGRGITIEDNLKIIHQNMRNEITDAGGRIDGIYYCADLDINSINRKPKTGMAMQAQSDFEGIDFSKSIMVGNNISDMDFGHSIGAKTILLLTTMDKVPDALPYLDGHYESLIQFAETL